MKPAKWDGKKGKQSYDVLRPATLTRAKLAILMVAMLLQDRPGHLVGASAVPAEIPSGLAWQRHQNRGTCDTPTTLNCKVQAEPKVSQEILGDYLNETVRQLPLGSVLCQVLCYMKNSQNNMENSCKPIMSGLCRATLAIMLVLRCHLRQSPKTCA